jgi:hypothetical protein
VQAVGHQVAGYHKTCRNEFHLGAVVRN